MQKKLSSTFYGPAYENSECLYRIGFSTVIDLLSLLLDEMSAPEVDALKLFYNRY
jgi:hypothetical protein